MIDRHKAKLRILLFNFFIIFFFTTVLHSWNNATFTHIQKLREQFANRCAVVDWWRCCPLV